MIQTRLGRDDANPTGLARAWLSANHDLDVLIDCRQKVHQALDREARQLVVAECRDFRLRDTEGLRSIGLRQFPVFKHLIQRVCETQLGVTFGMARMR